MSLKDIKRSIIKYGLSSPNRLEVKRALSKRYAVSPRNRPASSRTTSPIGGEIVVMTGQGSKDGQIDNEAKELLANLAGIIPFLATLPKSDCEYLGAGKTVDDKRCIVFWCRNKGQKVAKSITAGPQGAS
jgi:hypothetical protein